MDEAAAVVEVDEDAAVVVRADVEVDVEAKVVEVDEDAAVVDRVDVEVDVKAKVDAEVEAEVEAGVDNVELGIASSLKTMVLSFFIFLF